MDNKCTHSEMNQILFRYQKTFPSKSRDICHQFITLGLINEYQENGIKYYSLTEIGKTFEFDDNSTHATNFGGKFVADCFHQIQNRLMDRDINYGINKNVDEDNNQQKEKPKKKVKTVKELINPSERDESLYKFYVKECKKDKEEPKTYDEWLNDKYKEKEGL